MLAAAAMLGFRFGFVGSIPIAGPIAVLVLSRGLEDRARSAMYLALGAAVAEGGYAYLAFWGFAAYLTRYSWIEPTSRVVAAVLRTGLGLRFVRRPDGEPSRPMSDSRVGNKRAFLLGLMITALNPALIAGWTAAVTALYSLDPVRFEPAAALPFAVGACAGIAAPSLLERVAPSHVRTPTVARPPHRTSPRESQLDGAPIFPQACS